MPLTIEEVRKALGLSSSKMPRTPAQLETTVKSISVPLASKVADDGFSRRTMHIRLTRVQAKTWRRLFLALDASKARTSDGKPIVGPIDAIRWLLDQLA
jgi:hypothetical protein